jgi:broad specificity phosphatase PhoE
MFLYLVRHGECIAQCDPQRATDPDSPLSSVGIAQVQQTAALLAKQPITHILTSPLLWALQTATLLAEHLRIASVPVWPDLREMWDIVYDGCGRDDLQPRFPTAVFDGTFATASFRYGGDGHATMQERAQRVLQRVKAEYPSTSHIVIVSHGFAINYILHSLLEIAPACLHWFDHHNCGLSLLQIRPSEAQAVYPGYPTTTVDVLTLNSTAHLNSVNA